MGPLKKEIAATERMLKALIKSLENKPLHLFKADAAILEPLNPWPLFSNYIGEEP